MASNWNYDVPESDGTYLTWNGKEIEIKLYVVGEGFGNYITFAGNKQFFTSNVIAWMELPAPPSIKKEGN